MSFHSEEVVKSVADSVVEGVVSVVSESSLTVGWSKVAGMKRGPSPSPSSLPLLRTSPLSATKESSGMKATGTTNDPMASKSCLLKRPRLIMFLTMSIVLFKDAGTWLARRSNSEVTAVEDTSVVVVGGTVVGWSSTSIIPWKWPGLVSNSVLSPSLPWLMASEGLVGFLSTAESTGPWGVRGICEDSKSGFWGRLSSVKKNPGGKKGGSGRLTNGNPFWFGIWNPSWGSAMLEAINDAKTKVMNIAILSVVRKLEVNWVVKQHEEKLKVNWWFASSVSWSFIRSLSQKTWLYTCLEKVDISGTSLVDVLITKVVLEKKSPMK